MSKKPLVMHQDSVADFPGICGWVKELIKPTNSDLRRFDLALIAVEPRKASTPHLHRATEEVYYVLDGEGLVRIDGDEHRLRRGHAVYIPAGHRHQVVNTGQSTFTLLTVNAPPYDEADVHEIEETQRTS